MEFVVIWTDRSEELYVLDGRSTRRLAGPAPSMQNDADDDRDRMRRRYQGKRWWQFWIGRRLKSSCIATCCLTALGISGATGTRLCAWREPGSVNIAASVSKPLCNFANGVRQ